jgi:hypothetical protein
VQTEFVRNNKAQWEAETDLGLFYIELKGARYYAFKGSKMLHKPKKPFRHLAGAIQRCEDIYHTTKWPDGVTED